MSSKFVIDMPQRKVTLESSLFIGAGLLFMTGPVITLVSIAGDRRMPWFIFPLLVVSTLFGLVCGFMFIRSEIRKSQNKRAEKHLRAALQRMGYVALEPIEMNGTKDRILLRDDENAALWDVSISRSKIVCQKRT